MQFWHRWRRGKLNELKVRNILKNPQPKLKIGQLVDQIKDGSDKFQKWKLARFLISYKSEDELVRARFLISYKSEDGLVRAINLKTSSEIFTQKYY